VCGIAAILDILAGEICAVCPASTVVIIIHSCRITLISMYEFVTNELDKLLLLVECSILLRVEHSV
jgi:hypothetical protein